MSFNDDAFVQALLDDSGTLDAANAFVKVAEANGIDIDSMSDDQVQSAFEKIGAEMVGESSSEETPKEKKEKEDDSEDLAEKMASAAMYGRLAAESQFEHYNELMKEAQMEDMDMDELLKEAALEELLKEAAGDKKPFLGEGSATDAFKKGLARKFGVEALKDRLKNLGTAGAMGGAGAGVGALAGLLAKKPGLGAAIGGGAGVLGSIPLGVIRNLRTKDRQLRRQYGKGKESSIDELLKEAALEELLKEAKGEGAAKKVWEALKGAGGAIKAEPGKHGEAWSKLYNALRKRGPSGIGVDTTRRALLGDLTGGEIARLAGSGAAGAGALGAGGYGLKKALSKKSSIDELLKEAALEELLEEAEEEAAKEELIEALQNGQVDEEEAEKEAALEILKEAALEELLKEAKGNTFVPPKAVKALEGAAEGSGNSVKLPKIPGVTKPKKQKLSAVYEELLKEAALEELLKEAAEEELANEVLKEQLAQELAGEEEPEEEVTDEAVKQAALEILLS